MDEVKIYDSSYNLVGLTNEYHSLIWTERYCGFGDFEMVVPFESEAFDLCERDRLLQISDNPQRPMIIDSLFTELDDEGIYKTTVKGRSLESILDRRIIWNLEEYDDHPFVDAMNILVNNQMGWSTESSRQIPNWECLGNGDPKFDGLLFDDQLYGDNLYDVVTSACLEKKCGYCILMPEMGRFQFFVYFGENRSYGQTDNQFVVFSHEFENLAGTKTLKNREDYRNCCLVLGEGQGKARERVESRQGKWPGEHTGLMRRELYCDASSLSRTNDGVTMTLTRYRNKLARKGLQELQAHKDIWAFDGTIVETPMYEYGRDYLLGDKVMVVDDNGEQSTSIITEYIRSNDETEYKEYPTFEKVED